MNYVDSFETSFGPFSVAINEDGAVIATAFDGPERLTGFGLPMADLTHDRKRLAPVRKQLDEYFAGKRQDFDLELAPSGTSFQLRVWQALRDIPYGETRSYGDLARQLGSSPRAVGGANGANPISLIVPCHRVIGADGSLTGFGWGVDVKARLLEHEKLALALAAAGV